MYVYVSMYYTAGYGIEANTYEHSVRNGQRYMELMTKYIMWHRQDENWLPTTSRAMIW